MVVHSRQLGGAERHALTLATALREQGGEVVLVGPPSGWLLPAAAGRGVRCVPLAMRGRFDALAAWRLARLLRRERPDVLHAHLTRSTLYAAWARAWSGVRCGLVATAHATSAHRHFERADRVIAVSHAVAAALLRHGLGDGRVVTVHHGLPDPGWNDGEVAAGGALPRVRFGMLARFVADKGHDTALQALHRLLQRTDVVAELHLAGDAATPWGRAMRNLAEHLGLGASVVWHGATADPLGFLRGLDVVLVPSRREAFGLTALEAMAVGRPVLASALGGLPEVVEDGVTGRLLPVDDVPAWAEAMAGLVHDPARRRAWGRAGRRRFEEHFTLDAMLRATLDVYRAVVAQQGG